MEAGHYCNDEVCFKLCNIHQFDATKKYLWTTDWWHVKVKGVLRAKAENRQVPIQIFEQQSLTDKKMLYRSDRLV